MVTVSVSVRVSTIGVGVSIGGIRVGTIVVSVVILSIAFGFSFTLGNMVDIGISVSHVWIMGVSESLGDRVGGCKDKDK